MLTSLTPSSIAKEQQAPTSSDFRASSNAANQDSKQLFELIDSKFNQLAKKIIDELKQSQQSHKFCLAIDAALQEPLGAPTKQTRPVRNAHRNEAQPQQKSSSSTRQPSQARRPQASQARCEEPRSLPADVGARAEPSQVRAQAGSVQLAPQIARRVSPEARSPLGFPIAKSSTVGEVQAKRTKNLGIFAPSIITHPLLSKTPSVDQQVHKIKHGRDSDHEYDEYDRYDRDDEAGGDGDDDDDDDDDDDVDDDDDDQDDDDIDVGEEDEGGNEREGDERADSRPSKHQDRLHQDCFSPSGDPKASDATATRRQHVIKSRTYSDTNQVSESNNNTLTPKQQTYFKPQTVQQIVQKHQQKQQSLPNPPAQQQMIDQHQKQRQRFNPVVRSNTLGSANKQDKTAKVNQAAVKPMMLNKRDIGSLYKPHMNYSTSVLGNHRLSDDDEIIIIPTQSPSLISNSPDMNETNTGDESTERFSISRTKSFWEKLAKGNHGRRSAQNGDTTSMIGENDCLGKTGNHQYQFNAQNSGLTGNKTALVRSIYTKSNGKKVDSRQATNGPLSHNLDRMDSTGGSNSNYSCSSSGDENSGSHSQHNPVIGQIQEMSRQNRLRQTR